jgi:hypothetical protein
MCTQMHSCQAGNQVLPAASVSHPVVPAAWAVGLSTRYCRGQAPYSHNKCTTNKERTALDRGMGLGNKDLQTHTAETRN